jgi:hypothetical protein
MSTKVHRKIYQSPGRDVVEWVWEIPLKPWFMGTAGHWCYKLIPTQCVKEAPPFIMALVMQEKLLLFASSFKLYAVCTMGKHII